MAYNPLYRGKTSKTSSRSFSTGYTNGTLSGMLSTVPVSVDTSGKIAPTDVSDEVSALNFVGLTGEAIPSSASGQVISGGRFDSASLAGFSVGNPIWIGKSGTLTNIQPDIGVNGFVSGDFVIFIGVVVKNEFNPLNKDIQILSEIIGQL